MCAFVLLILCLGMASAFQQDLRRWRPTRLFSAPLSNSENAHKDMEELIVSLSLEPTDESRRERLANLFQQALAQPNGNGHQFANLFDQTVIQVGDRVRKEALEKLEQAQNDEPIQGKTPEEWQVWALIDMMVQSKTLVKRANGELGNSGSFA